MSPGKHNWENYIKLSECLLDDSNFPEFINSSRRSAISRAYYGAFCLARNLADENGWVTLTHTGKDHGLVKEHYKDCSDKQKQKIGTKLDRLLKNRRKADYNNNSFDKLKNHAHASVTMANHIKKMIDEIETNQP